MNKRLGPALSRDKIPLKRCKQCHGRGLVKPMFYEMTCNACAGLGALRVDTGDALDPEDAVVQLRIRLEEKERELASLRRKLAADQSDDSAGRGYGETRGHGPMGMKYHGD
ncbi:hypothetical protein MLC59_02020 [Marinobacter bryozoorum]|uniref:hypothetical protein n=1 Tax=Marinobacter bryozoorum TaxID=256324 RepID=UPI002002ADC9|nr:hypothetical protein [Marinobacter bryozoorum]MCK7542946.1 hypothetical protein [Marinobacter bryozoorum]